MIPVGKILAGGNDEGALDLGEGARHDEQPNVDHSPGRNKTKRGLMRAGAHGFPGWGPVYPVSRVFILSGGASNKSRVKIRWGTRRTARDRRERQPARAYSGAAPTPSAAASMRLPPSRLDPTHGGGVSDHALPLAAFSTPPRLCPAPTSPPLSPR